MNKCEQCLALNRYPKPDAEVIDCEIHELNQCDFYPDGIPPDIWAGKVSCKFQNVD